MGRVNRKLVKNNYYSVLKIEPQASQEEVRAAFRRLALLYHPDRSKHPRAIQRMQLLNEAYEVLNHQEKRAQYDLERMALPAQEIIPASQYPVYQPRPEQKAWKARARKPDAWIKNRLKILARLILLVSGLFLWSLATGQVNIAAIVGFVLLAVYVIATMIINLKNSVR